MSDDQRLTQRPGRRRHPVPMEVTPAGLSQHLLYRGIAAALGRVVQWHPAGLGPFDVLYL